MLTMRKKAKHRMIQDADCTSDLKFWPAPALFALTLGAIRAKTGLRGWER
jgi:hypothetical protein